MQGTVELYNRIFEPLNSMNLSEFFVSNNITLTEWQANQLQGLPLVGMQCLLKSWVWASGNPIQESHCNATWDEVTCWPATLADSVATVACSEVLQSENMISPEDLNGSAYRYCSGNASWYSGNWTDYSECGEALEDNLRKLQRIATPAKYIVRYILFYGSIASLLCLTGALSIFFYFKSIRCERIKIHIHMMLALLLKSLIILIITTPTVFKTGFSYRAIDWVCKLVISLQFYATLASINWMFVHGHYLNSKLTNVVMKRFPMKYYIFIGWVIPLGIIGIWSVATESLYGTKCWKNYAKLPTFWILVSTLSIVLAVNLLLLLNILRLVISSSSSTGRSIALTRHAVGNKIKRGTKATAILFPLLGMTNLLFFYNPGGDGQKYYMVSNASLQVLQGILASVLYCFICKDVRDVIRREYIRLRIQRNRKVLRRMDSRLTVSFNPKDAKISTNLQRGEPIEQSTATTVMDVHRAQD